MSTSTSTSTDNQQTVIQDAAYQLSTTYLSKKAAFAYIKFLLLHSIFLVLIAVTAHYLPLPAALLMLFWAGFFMNQYMYIRSYQLFYDNDGVWVSSGYLPWSKTLMGMKWRDLDSAVFFNNLSSWATQSHAILLNHRFTPSNGVLLSDMSNASLAVTTINHVHNELIDVGRLK